MRAGGQGLDNLNTHKKGHQNQTNDFGKQKQPSTENLSKMSFYGQNHLSVSWKNPLKEIILYCFNLKSWKIITFMGIGLVGCHRWSTLLIGIIPFFMCVWSVTLWCILAVMFQFSECKPFASLFLRFS